MKEALRAELARERDGGWVEPRAACPAVNATITRTRVRATARRAAARAPKASESCGKTVPETM
jgi:hypothetical protein